MSNTMDNTATWSPRALQVCVICDFIWASIVFAGCTYIVFWLNQSGWWYVFAMLLASAWQCKHLRSPEQIAADKEDEAD